MPRHTVKPDEGDPTEMVTEKDGVWRMDVDTFLPKPEGYIKIKRVEYPIYSFIDVPIDASLKVARLGDDIKAAELYDEKLERSIEQIILLNQPSGPDLPAELHLTREHFRGVSPKQIITLTVLASSIAGVPQKAAAEETSSSPSPSPASAGSTGGSEGNSSD
jgi:hypothetical protein